MAIKKGNYYSTGGALSDSKINTVVYLSNQGKMEKIKTLINKLKNDAAVDRKGALKQIKLIVEEKNEDIWKAAQEGTLEKVKSSEIKKVDMEKVKTNLNAILDFCAQNSNNTRLSKKAALDAVKKICNDSNKDKWKDITDEVLI